MRLSYSAISTYQVCPMQYKFRYVDKMPALPSPAISFGRSLHEALRWFYDVPTPDPPSLEELIDYLETCWISEGYASPEEEAKYFFHAMSVLHVFYKTNIEDFRIPLALEQSFLVDLDFCELSGVIDRLDKRETGEIEIIDYKTNRRVPPSNKLYEDLQLPIYHIATIQTWDLTPDMVTFYYLIPNHRHTIKVTNEWLSKAVETIRKVVTRIEAEIFDPRENALCPWCDYLDDCPLMRNKLISKKSSEPPDMEIGMVVDELISLKKRIPGMLRRAQGLEKILRAYLYDRRINAVAGSSGIVSLDRSGNICVVHETGSTEIESENG